MGNAGFTEFTQIIEKRVTEYKNAKEKGVKDYFKDFKDVYNEANIPRVEEKCLIEKCYHICNGGPCSGSPSFKSLIAYFTEGRFVYIYKTRESVVVQSKYEQYCSEITDKISKQIEILPQTSAKPSLFKEVEINDTQYVEHITFSIKKETTTAQDIFNHVYKSFTKFYNGNKLWAFIYDNKKYMVDMEDWILVANFKAKKSKKIVKSIKVMRRTPKKSHPKKSTRRVSKKVNSKKSR